MIVGLGNPGEAYARTRHNVGFRTVDLLAQRLDVKIDRVKCKALTRLVELAGHKVLLVKPQTYMNASGQSVLWASQYYKVPPERILVLSDDISLPVGRIRVRAQGSAGGHNGLKSIIADLKSQEFPRVKIGVGAKPCPEYDLADWVLSNFTAQEEKALKEAIDHAADAAVEVLRAGVPSAASRFNGK
ncbi:MAG: aminoacyl-tRNA hydrolase [Firmicutes bacterium]|nr:aminoacyl-tRNA hydrolase [Bacillota bacterium]MDY2720558.1 aminoacyl-tRNA hydrolase [Candidatus Faecousia sp.]